MVNLRIYNFIIWLASDQQVIYDEDKQKAARTSRQLSFVAGWCGKSLWVGNTLKEASSTAKDNINIEK